MLSATLEDDRSLVRQVANLADALDQSQRVLVDEKVLDDVSLDLRVRDFEANVLWVEMYLFEDVEFRLRPLRCI
ncbi:hypothetical protein [Brevibacterium picturae]